MDHPINPPPALVMQWYRASPHANEQALQDVATQAAGWGADQELKACCKLLELSDPSAREFLYAARRLKPQSLKQQALKALKHAEEGWRPVPADCDTIRRALEQLDD